MSLKILPLAEHGETEKTLHVSVHRHKELPDLGIEYRASIIHVPGMKYNILIPDPPLE